MPLPCVTVGDSGLRRAWVAAAVAGVVAVGGAVTAGLARADGPPAVRCGAEIGPDVAPATSGVQVRDVDPYAVLPYQYRLPGSWGVAPLTVDDAGHVRYADQGRGFVHPVASAQYGLAALREYQSTGDRAWLGRAETAARDVLGEATPEDLFPYLMPWAGPDGKPAPVPGFSAMAQGQMLSLLVRLAAETGDGLWSGWAVRVFATMARIGTPAVTFVDRGGYLWFEEFSTACPGRVFNGHMFALFGVLDYYRATGDPRARALVDAAVTTVEHYLPQMRNPGHLSSYGVTATGPNAYYHPVHIAQLDTLSAVTGRPVFGRWADLLRADAHFR